MSNSFSLLIRFVFAFVDLLAMNIVFFFLEAVLLGREQSFNGSEYLYFWIYINVIWLACCGLYSLYEPKFTGNLEVFVKRTAHAYSLFLVLAIIYLYFNRQLEISRIFVSVFLAGVVGALMVNRLLYQVVRLQFRKNEYLIKRVMIIGYNEVAKKLAATFEKGNNQVQLVGYCEEFSNVKELSNYPILDTPGNAIKASRDLQVTEIYSTILPEQNKKIYELMQMADQACIRFKLVPDFSVFVNRPMHLNYQSGMPVLSARTEPLDDLANRIKKRTFDIIFSLLVIIFVLSWLMPLISLAIWLNSRGPVFFVQKRSGLNNKPFNCFKFRSMYVNKDANKRQARPDDARFTSVGRFIRRTNLDEFPQFFNVLFGDMSIVGPRPHMLKHTADYSAIISQYMVRQFIKPGITGWAQVNGYRGEIRKTEDIQERVDHDIWYVENWNPVLDLKIIALTVINTLRGEKNAF
jgi:Undecaprenyl-phosphate glucose phosphotransferase